MNNIKKNMKLLGCKVVDKVTGFKGVVSSISFDLYGCIQALITPPINKSNERGDSRWYDVNRLNVVSKKAVMEVPDFESEPKEDIKGPADKPIF